MKTALTVEKSVTIDARKKFIDYQREIQSHTSGNDPMIVIKTTG